MKYIKAYFKAWASISTMLSFAFMFYSLLFGFNSLFSVYLLYIVYISTVSSIAGPIKELIS